jgi:DNA-directed RNA polymerase subunit beta'
LFSGTKIPIAYAFPSGAIMRVRDGARISSGDVIARIPLETSKQVT